MTKPSIKPTEPTFSSQQITMMLTHISGVSWDQFITDFLPYIDSLDHFQLTLRIYRSNPKYTWEHSASIARR